MPWREVTRMSLREEFVKLAMQAGANRRELCRRFGIAPKTGYKWLCAMRPRAAAVLKIARGGRGARPCALRQRSSSA